MASSPERNRLRGQYLLVDPLNRTVVARTETSEGDVGWIRILRQFPRGPDRHGSHASLQSPPRAYVGADRRWVATLGVSLYVDADERKVVGVCPVQPLNARVKAL